MRFNPEILSTTPTHRFNGVLVKIFPSTQNGNTVSAEIMEGEHEGKNTTVYLDQTTPVTREVSACCKAELYDDKEFCVECYKKDPDTTWV